MTDLNRLVWMSYRKDLRWKTAWEKLTNPIGFIVVLIQMLGNLPINSFDLEGRQLAYYYCITVFVIFSMLSAFCVELQLPKQMFLTPLAQTERKEYMEKLLRLKIGLPNVIMSMVALIMVVFRVVHISMAILLVVQNILMTMEIGLCHLRSNPDGRRVVITEGSMFWFACAAAIGFLSEVLIMGECSKYVAVERDGLIFWVIGAAIQAFCLYKLYSRKNHFFEHMANYERLNLIEEKKEVKSAW